MKRRWKGYRDPTHIALHGPCYWRQVATEVGYHIAREATTGLSGIPILDRMPMGLIHWIPGFFYEYTHGDWARLMSALPFVNRPS